MLAGPRRRMEDTMVTNYSIICDACQGRSYVNNQMCEKCDGNGRIVVWASREQARDLKIAHWFNVLLLFLLLAASVCVAGIVIWRICEWIRL
jgi:hypothetical protein